MNNIYYDFDKYNINEKSARELDRLVEAMKLNPTVEIKIYSHTDEKGTARYNMKLSQKRAKSVIDYLVTHGIDSKRLQSEGKGETEPIVKCDRQSTNAECAQNRRTEFKITKY